MNKKAFWLSIIGILISFAGGFLLANALNRKELDDLRAEVGRLKQAPTPQIQENSSSPELTDEEIRRKIAEADGNPENTEFQKNLGMALYRYASMRQQPVWLKDVARLLNRVYEKNPKDYNTIVSLGNVYFDIAQEVSKTDAAEKAELKEDKNQNLEKARSFYQKALAINPNDADIRTDFGLTFMDAAPPNNNRAIEEFQKSLKINPQNEKTLESVTRALLINRNFTEAEKFLNELKKVNPNSEVVSDLQQRIDSNK